MTMEQHNELVKSNLFNFSIEQIKMIIKQYESYNTNLDAYGDMIFLLNKELDRRNL